MKKVAEKAMLLLVPFLGALLIRLLSLLNRLEVVGGETPRAFWSEGKNVIMTFWHDQLLLMPKAYQGPGVRILISASKDGELIARTMRHFGFGTVRGSSSRNGRAAFRELLELARHPFDLVLTPDGPRGPRHRIKEGVVQLARLSGRPVIPVVFVCSRGRRLGSWDRFLLPYPFGRGVFLFGPPQYFQPGEEVCGFRDRLQAAMEESERAAVAHLETYGVSAV